MHFDTMESWIRIRETLGVVWAEWPVSIGHRFHSCCCCWHYKPMMADICLTSLMTWHGGGSGIPMFGGQRWEVLKSKRKNEKKNKRFTQILDMVDYGWGPMVMFGGINVCVCVCVGWRNSGPGLTRSQVWLCRTKSVCVCEWVWVDDLQNRGNRSFTSSSATERFWSVAGIEYSESQFWAKRALTTTHYTGIESHQSTAEYFCAFLKKAHWTCMAHFKHESIYRPLYVIYEASLEGGLCSRNASHSHLYTPSLTLCVISIPPFRFPLFPSPSFHHHHHHSPTPANDVDPFGSYSCNRTCQLEFVYLSIQSTITITITTSTTSLCKWRKFGRVASNPCFPLSLPL